MSDTKRREFVTLLGGAVAWPFSVRAQQGAPKYRIGILLVGLSQASKATQHFRRGLRDSHRQFADQLLARSQGPLSNHSQE
jgi:hypothetical protein